MFFNRKEVEQFMTDTIFEIIKLLMSVIVSLVCLILSRFRYSQNKKYAAMYANNKNILILRLLITYLLRGLTVVLLLGILTGWIGSFVAFYIIIPALISLTLILFDSTDWMKGFVIFVKGLYNVGLVIVSLVQFLLNSTYVEILAIGFTISLGIFESVDALFDGYLKMQEKNDDRSEK